jgi:Na+/melibiose symporter-like transporter
MHRLALIIAACDPVREDVMAGKDLSLGTKLDFGVADLGGNLFFTVGAFIVLKYLTDVVRLDP